MAGPGGRTVGRVSLRVVPDTSRLREDIQKVITRIERTVEATIRTKLDTDHLRGEAQRAICIVEEALDADIKVNLDTTGLGAEITSAQERIEAAVKDVTATIKADLDLALARARLGAFTERPRTVTIFARMNEGSLGKVTTMLSALSGARSTGKVLDRIGDALKNLDKSIPAISGVTLVVGNLASAALSSVAGLFAVGAGVAAISGALLALPGIVGGFAVGITAMALALADITTQLGSLGPAFANLQNVTSGAFWNVARQPILDMVNGLLPQLTAGFAATGKALGGFFADFAANLQRTLGGGVLEGMFASLTSSIDIARQAMSPLAELIATLGSVGASYLPGLAQNFVNVTSSINSVIQAAAGDGRLKGWIDGGIQQAGFLFSALGGIAQILGGIANAAQAAGTGGLGTFAASMHRIADLVSGPEFQGALANIFRGANSAVANLSVALGPLGNLLVSMSPVISSALQSLGNTAGQLLGALAGALNDPAVAEGLLGLVQGIAAGVQGLLPLYDVISGTLGALGSTMGVFAGVVGNVLGAALGALAPVLTAVLQTVQPLIVLLGTALVGTINQLAPLLMQLVTAILPPLASVIEAIIPALATIIGALLPVIATLIPPVAQIVTLVATAVVALLPVVAALVAQLVTSLAPVLMQLVNALLPLLVTTFATLIPIIAELLPVIGELVSTLLDNLVPVIEALLPIVSAVFEAAAKVVTAALDIVIGVVKAFSGLLKGDWSLLWEGVKQILTGALGLIVAAITNVGPVLVALLKGAWDLIVAGVSLFLGNIVSLMSSGWQRAVDTIRAVIAALPVVVGAAVGLVITVVSGFRGTIINMLSSAGTWLVNAGKAIIDGLVQGIRSAASRVTDAVKDVMSAARAYFPFSPAKKGAFSGSGYTSFSGRALVEDFAAAIQSRQKLVTAATAGMMAAAQPVVRELGSSSFTPAAAAAEAAMGPVYVQNPWTGEYMLAQVSSVADDRIATDAGLRLVSSRMGSA